MTCCVLCSLKHCKTKTGWTFWCSSFVWQFIHNDNIYLDLQHWVHSMQLSSAEGVLELVEFNSVQQNIQIFETNGKVQIRFLCHKPNWTQRDVIFVENKFWKWNVASVRQSFISLLATRRRRTQETCCVDYEGVNEMSSLVCGQLDLPSLKLGVFLPREFTQCQSFFSDLIQWTS
jgi:hypothetical protein